MQTQVNSQSNINNGTAYAIGYTFKTGYNYTMTVDMGYTANPSTAFPKLTMSVRTTLPNPNDSDPISCGPVSSSKYLSSVGDIVQIVYPSQTSIQTYNIPQFSVPSQRNYLVLTISDGGLNGTTALINKITITESIAISFTLSPSTLQIPCGSATTQTFTVNNVNNTPGTIIYNWNLGSSNNGWIYNGSPAPQSFQTTTNSINLTPSSGSTSLSNVSVTINLNGSNNTTLTSTISRSSGATQGSYLPMTGSSIVCGSSENYSLTGVPAGATVSWSLGGVYTNGSYLPLQNVCTLSSNGTLATLTKVNNGTVTLLATITNCDGIQQYSSKTVTFGVPELYGNAGYYIDNIYLTQPIEGTATFLNSSSFYITLESSGTNTYVWESSSSSNANYNFGYTGNNFATCWWSTPLNPYDYFGFTVFTTNACGTRSDPMYFYYDGQYQYYRVAPNPVKSTFNIKQVDFKRNPIPKGKKQINVDLLKIQIVDKMGNVVLEQIYPSDTKSTTVNTLGLKSDIYTVRLFTQDKKVESHRIIVQH